MRFRVGLLVLLALGALVLASPWRTVYGGGDGVRLLVDTDPHYHVLRAERILAGAPGAPWRDPAMDAPNGADVPWPPLFDLAIAGAARLTGAQTRDDVARSAAALPAVLGLLSIALVALAGRRLAGEGAGLAAAALVALLPAHALAASLGRVDQHVAEIALATLVALAFARGLTRGPDRAAVLGLAAGVVLAFWTWMGSTLALVAPCAAVAVARLAGLDGVARQGAVTLALGLGVGAAALAGSVAAFGRPGALAHPSVLGVGGLHVAILAGAAAFAGVLAWRARATATPRWLRPVEIALAAALPSALLLGLWPALREGVQRGLVALAAANPWYADIVEFNPLLFSGLRPVASDLAASGAVLGLTPVAAALAIPAGVERWRAEPASRPGLLFLAVWTPVMFAFALARSRFLPYAAVPLAISSGLGAIWAGRRLAAAAGAPRLAPAAAAVALAIVLAPAMPALASLPEGEARVPERWIEAARWLRSAPPALDGRSAVAAPWNFGHLVQYYADRPVVATPFGTEAGPRALPDWATFLFTADPAEAEGVLLARGVSHVLLRNPSHELVGLRGFAERFPAPIVATRDVWNGETVGATPRFTQLVASRLYFEDGAGPASIEGMRLVFEGPSTGPLHPLQEERIVAYEVVAGAEVRVSGAAPGAPVTATMLVTSPTGRRFQWSSRRTADGRGGAAFRVPYATGANAGSAAGPCVVSDGRAAASVEVPESAVLRGEPVPIALRR